VSTRGYSRDRPGTGVLWPLRHGRGPRVAVLSCAGAYVSGAAGSNECPAGSARIEAEAACRTAVAAAGKTAGSTEFRPFLPFVETASLVPRGCYYYAFPTGTNYAYFNMHAVGAGHYGTQLLCAALTTGAPLARRRACAARYSRAVGLIIQTA
jgi:hypothetical protein